MIFEDCKLFRDVAHTRSLSRAAALNGISQPAATQHIQDLERRLRVQLLDRSVRPIGLTNVGKLYAELCRDVLHREENFIAAMEAATGVMKGTVRIASIYSIGLPEMAGLRTEFALACPSAELQVDYLRPDKVYKAIQEDQADLGFISYPEHRSDLKVIPWRVERMTVILCPSHRLARLRLLAPNDLNGEVLISLADGEEFMTKRQMVSLSRHMMRVEKLHNIGLVKDSVAQGEGISFLPEWCVQSDVEQKRLVSIPLGSTCKTRPMGIIHRRGKTLSPIGREFLNLVVADQTSLRK